MLDPIPNPAPEPEQFLRFPFHNHAIYSENERKKTWSALVLSKKFLNCQKTVIQRPSVKLDALAAILSEKGVDKFPKKEITSFVSSVSLTIFFK
jgi:hypothetical protein